jgi:purine-nucleoside phosphorylase
MKLLQKLDEAKTYLLNRMKQDWSHDVPKVAITLGSGLGVFCDALEDTLEVPYSDIPHFHATTVAGHDGKLVLGRISGKSVLVFQGRIHAYEGHSFDEVTFATRLVKVLGAQTLLLTNASGGMNPNYRSGDLVMITDHINFTGHNPLRGPNLDELGPRFPDMSTTWTPAIQETLQACAKKMSYKLNTGVYFGVMGPSYETPTEIKMFRSLGADMVGMSTVAEAIVARHCGLNLGGISCITNMAAGLHDGELDHADIKEEANRVKDKFVNLLSLAVQELG